MKKQNIIIIIIIVVAAAGLVAYQQGLIPPQGLAGIQADNAATMGGAAQSNTSADTRASTSLGGQQNWAQGINASAPTSLEYDDIQLVLTNVDANQKQALMDNEEAFVKFVKQEASQLSLLAAAKSNNLDADTNSQFLMQRSAENVLREIYLNRLIKSKVPADFPNEEQIKQYYDTNKENLVVEERVSVWQIFLPVSEGMDSSSVENEAKKIADDIKAGRIDFTNAALSNSQHQPSKLNGGYMGILKVSELIPGIHEPLMSLDEGEVSSPIKSEMGFHILKRDEVIPSQSVTLEQVSGQIRNLLINQVRTKLRNEILALAAETFPITVDDELIKEWRNRLQSE